MKSTSKKKRRNRIREYSKRILMLMTALWFLGAIFGMGVIIAQIIRDVYSVSLDALLAYIGAPMTGGIISYLIKSAIENKQKIKGSSDVPENYEV